MTLKTIRAVGVTCSVVIAVLAVVAIIYAAGSKLGTIETEIKGVKSRLTSIEHILEAKGTSDGRSVADASGLRDGATRGSDMGSTVAIVGLLPASASDNTDGARVLHGDR